MTLLKNRFLALCVFVLIAAASTARVVCTASDDGTEGSCSSIARYGAYFTTSALSSVENATALLEESLRSGDFLQDTLKLEPMPLFENVVWSAWDQWRRVLVYTIFIATVRKLIIEKLWTSTWDRIQVRKIVVGTLMVYDIASHLAFDSKGLAVYPVWAEIAMVIENFILLRKELMTSPSKWAHDILLLVSFALVTHGFYYHAPEKVYSRKWMHFHGSLFYGAWMLESVFLFCNHKSRRGTINSKIMKIFLGITICCCVHNIFFLLGHAYFVFYDTFAPLAIAIGFTQQWSLWTYKIYTKGVR